MIAAFDGGCFNSSLDPVTYVNGLRVLAIKAEPPEVPAGATATVTALAIDTDGDPITMAWSQCLDPPLSSSAINPDCTTMSGADYLIPFGAGLSVMTTMPMVNPFMLGRPDTSGGLYLPLIGRASAGPTSLTATYLLRLNLGLPANNNPVVAGVFQVLGGTDGGTTDVVPVDDAHPLVAHAGDQITLRVTFMPGSAESYSIYDGNPATTPPRDVTETLSASWFSTAGTFEGAASGADVPDTILHLDQARNGPKVHLPASGGTIDLWVVGRDERGGTDYLHRTLQFE
ncbi:MAG TPA: hypothetical protein VG222_12420 [Vicinamibacterales bacterium]|nr:hypothetical protein [Vicinamibacterales bacterium]